MPWIRNAIGAACVAILFIALGILGPELNKKEAELRCAPDYRVEAIFSDMVACAKVDDRQGKQCSCSRPENEWARWYSTYLVPLALGLFAWLQLRGSVGARIGWLNGGIWSAVFIIGLYYEFTNIEGVEALVLGFGHLIYVAVISSLVLLFCNLIAHGVRRYASRTPSNAT